MRVIMVAAVLCASIAIDAQSPAQNTPLETAHLTVSTSTGNAAGRIVLNVDVSPKAKMHVYAPGEKDAIPVELTLDPSPSIKAGKPVFPPPQKYFFAPLKLTQLVYSQPFRITQPITIVRTPADGTATISGTLHYQACDDAVCYVPKQVKLSWVVKAH